MKFCTKCGKQNHDYVEKCERCGGPDFAPRQTLDIWKKDWDSRSGASKGCAIIVVGFILLIILGQLFKACS